VDAKGKGVLHHACESQNVEIIKELINRKVDINLRDSNEYTAFNIACENGYIEIVELLLANGASMDSPSCISSLCIACRSDNTDLVKLLLRKGLNPNFVCNKTLPIHICCYNQNIEVIKLLLLKTDKIDVEDKNNFTPLTIAIRNNHLAMVKLVVDGFISDKIYRITLLSDIFSVYVNSIKNTQIREYIQSKIELYRKTVFTNISSNYQDIVIITKN
jgi:ankyrin repeat protein